jgi:hypothetical protein
MEYLIAITTLAFAACVAIVIFLTLFSAEKSATR